MGRALGLGSAKEGVAHWWMQRVTALALVPLCLWFAASVIGLAGADWLRVAAWIHRPVNAILMVLMLVPLFYHMALGIQVVIEDYVHTEWVKLASVLALWFVAIALAVASIFAVLRIATIGG